MVICFYLLWSQEEKLSSKAFEEQVAFLTANFQENPPQHLVIYPARDFAETRQKNI